MCGIYGYDLTNINLPIETKMTLLVCLAMYNVERGYDSYGYLYFDDKNNPVVKKGLGQITKEMAHLSKYDVAFCHTRHATTGKVKIKNCHPFKVGNIIGCHNGVIDNHKELNEKYKRKCSVDSQHIFYHLSENKDLNEINGYGTIVYVKKYNIKPKVYLSMLTYESELAMVEIEYNGQKGIVYSSDEQHLESAIENAGLKCLWVDIEPCELYQITGGKVYCIENAIPEHCLGERLTRKKWSDFGKKDKFDDSLNERNWDQWEDGALNSLSLSVEHGNVDDHLNHKDCVDVFEANDFHQQKGGLNNA